MATIEKATCKTCGFYENNCPFIRGKFMPYPNYVCKDYTFSTLKAEQLLKSSPLPEDTLIFKKGVEEGKRLMMEDAAEGEVENGSFGIVYLRKNLVNEGYSTGDKVRIIILPKED